MTLFAASYRSKVSGLLGAFLFARGTPTFAEYDDAALDSAINRALYQAVYLTAEAARAKADTLRCRRASDRDSLEARRLSQDTRRELGYIQAAHESEMATLENRYYRKLTELARMFEKDARLARAAHQVRRMRKILEAEVHQLDAKFRRDLNEEYRRYQDRQVRVAGLS